MEGPDTPSSLFFFLSFSIYMGIKKEKEHKFPEGAN